MATPGLIDTIYTGGADHLGTAWPLVWNLIKIILIVAPLMGAVAYLTLWERKLIGWIQIRIGPNRVGPGGFLQPIADGVKLLLKEILVPSKASTGLFVIGPIMTIMPALAAWVVVPRRRWPTSTPASCCCWRSPRWRCTASSSPAGRRTRSSRSWARCVPRPR
jgi:NADH-quinone oxidoreductase subunit H